MIKRLFLNESEFEKWLEGLPAKTKDIINGTMYRKYGHKKESSGDHLNENDDDEKEDPDN